MDRHLRTAAEIDRLRTRRHHPDFAAAWAALDARATRALAERLRPPTAGGGWGHHYYCPTHSVPLDFDAAAPGEHRCPVDGENIIGPHMDRAWNSRLSNEAIQGAIACALVWLATDSAEHLAHAVGVLDAYVDLYPAIAPHGDIVGTGRVHGTALEESFWAIVLAQLADDVRPALEPAHRERVDALLAQVLAQVDSEMMGKIHNIECWHLAAQISLATVLGRAEAVEAALAGDFGLRAQLRAGIRADGWWAEGSPHYHYYMLGAVQAAATALRGSHPELAAAPELAAMIGVPLTMLRPDLSFVALNDGWFDIALPQGIAQYADLHERAWDLWGAPGIPALLRACYESGTSRDGVSALLSGPEPDRIAAAGPLPPTRAVHEASGYAVVDDGERALHLKFGPHGGGHGHPDKLQLDLWVRGVRVLPDLGSPAYNSPLQGPWIRQTLSHNTAAFAGISQPPVVGRLLSAPHAADGAQPLALDAEVSWTAADTTVHGSWLAEPRFDFPPEYEGASLRRLVLWSPAGYLVDVLDALAPSGARVDLSSRLLGEVGADPTEDAGGWAPLGETQEEFLREPRALPPGPWRATWVADGVRTAVWGVDPDGATAVLARCPGAHLDEEQTMVLRSLPGGTGRFVTVLDTRADVRAVRVGAEEIVIEHAGGTDRWSLEEHGGPTRVLPGTHRVQRAGARR